MAHDCGVYVISNAVNGHRYVGSACSFKKRFKEHLRQLSAGKHHSRYLQRAWNKHGPCAFSFERVLYCDRSNLIPYEQSVMDSLNPEYNIVPIAGSQLGYRHTDETRKKMSVARRRNPSSPRKGMQNSEESKRKVSAKKTGVRLGPYSQERIDRSAAGMRSTKSVLDEEKVRHIRALKRRGLSAPKVAKILGCTHHVVYDICSGRTWGWVA